MSDTGLIGEVVSWRLMDIIWGGAYLAGVLVVMFAINRKLAFGILAILPVATALMVYFQRRLLVYNRRIREINSRITGDYNEGITGAGSVKVLGIEEKLEQEFETDTALMRRTSVREAHFSALFISSVTMMSSAALALVLWQGGHLTRAGQIGRAHV